MITISPCMYRGTQQFVHRSCLDHWRSVKEGFAFFTLHHLQSPISSPIRQSRGKLLAQIEVQNVCGKRCFLCLFGCANCDWGDRLFFLCHEQSNFVNFCGNM